MYFGYGTLKIVIWKYSSHKVNTIRFYYVEQSPFENPRRQSRKSLFVATKTGHGGRLLRSLNAAELPVERSNPLRTGWCQTQARVVCIVYCRDGRSYGKDAVAGTGACFNRIEQSHRSTIIFLPTNDTYPHLTSPLPSSAEALHRIP